MYIPLDVLILIGVGLLMIVGVILAQQRMIRLLRGQLALKDRPIQAIIIPPSGIPEPGPHEHVWAKKPAATRAQWRIYPCTVPGCRADPLCRAGRE